jgi:hypothetical protein
MVRDMSAPVPLAITPELSALIGGALDAGHPLLLAAVDASQRPVLSFRGSVAVFDEARLGFWARNADGGTLEAIRRNPHVALAYRSPTVPVLQFIGRARITDDPAERDRAFDLSHERERARDPDRTGRAVIVDLDQVTGVLAVGDAGPIRVNMTRMSGQV